MKRWQQELEGRSVARTIRAALIVGGLFGAVGMASAQTLRWLGTLGGGWSEARGVSADGTVVIGISHDDQSRYRAFRWTANGGMQDLGTLGGRNSMAYGMTPDGSKIVGTSELNDSGEERATLWEITDNGVNILNLGTLTFSGNFKRSAAYAISADGNTVVGYSYADQNQWGGAVHRACRWKLNTTPISIEQLDTNEDIDPDPNITRRRLTGVGSCAFAVSANGEALTGVWGWGWGFVGFYWNDNAQNPSQRNDLRGDRLYVLLGVTNVFNFDGRGTGYGISADGKVAVGYATDNQLNLRPARWVYNPSNHALDGPTFLGSLGGLFGTAHATNQDGSIIVGWATLVNGEGHAFIWDAQNGMRDLNTVYANLLNDGSILERAIAITADGRFIVGVGYNAQTSRREAYLLDTVGQYRQREADVNGDGCVDDADLLTVLFNFGATGQNAADVNRDGTVDDADLLSVLFNFGGGC